MYLSYIFIFLSADNYLYESRLIILSILNKNFLSFLLIVFKYKEEKIKKKRSSKIMNGYREKITIEQCHTINIKLDKIGK